MSSDRVRSTCYSLLIYPEKISLDEVKYLLNDNFMLDYALSPVHEQEEDFKPHRHLMLFFPNPISISTAQRIGERLGSPKFVFIPPNVITAMRYLIHADDSDKQQFEKGKEEIILHGLRSKKIFNDAFSNEEGKRVCANLRAIHNYVVENHIQSVAKLQQYLLMTDYASYLLVRDNYRYFDDLCKSTIQFKFKDFLDMEKGHERKVDVSSP